MSLSRNVLKDKTTRFVTWSGEVLYAPLGHPVMDTLSSGFLRRVSLSTEMCKQQSESLDSNYCL